MFGSLCQQETMPGVTAEAAPVRSSEWCTEGPHSDQIESRRERDKPQQVPEQWGEGRIPLEREDGEGKPEKCYARGADAPEQREPDNPHPPSCPGRYPGRHKKERAHRGE